MPLPRFLIPAVVLAAVIAVVLVLVLRAPEAPPTVSVPREALVPLAAAAAAKLPPEAGAPLMACETLAQKSEAPCKAYAAGISSELRASDPEFHEYDCANDLLNPYLDILDLAVGASCGGLRTQDGRELCNALAAGCAGTSGRLAALCAAYRDQDPALCKPADEPPEGLAEGAEYDLHFLGEFGCDMSLAYYRVAKGDSAACSKGGHGNGAGRAFCEAITTNTCTARFERLFEDYGRLDLRLCDGIFDPWIKAQCRAGADAAVLVREDLSHIPS